MDVAHTRESRPDSGFSFQVNVFETFQGVLSSLNWEEGHLVIGGVAVVRVSRGGHLCALLHAAHLPMAHRRQSRPDSGHGFQVNVVRAFQVVFFSLDSDWEEGHLIIGGVAVVRVLCGRGRLCLCALLHGNLLGGRAFNLT